MPIADHPLAPGTLTLMERPSTVRTDNQGDVYHLLSTNVLLISTRIHHPASPYADMPSRLQIHRVELVRASPVLEFADQRRLECCVHASLKNILLTVVPLKTVCHPVDARLDSGNGRSSRTVSDRAGLKKYQARGRRRASVLLIACLTFCNPPSSPRSSSTVAKSCS